MKKHTIELLKREKVGKDRLGNNTYETISIKLWHCMLTEWTTSDIEIYGRQVTEGSRKVLIRPPVSLLEGISDIRIGGDTYKIEDVKDLGRWILLIVKGYRL